MCDWKKWIWPGILATVLLTALAMLMHSGIERLFLFLIIAFVVGLIVGWVTSEKKPV